MTKPLKLAIVHPRDPWGKHVGGITSFTRGLVQYAPDGWDITWIGVTARPERHPKLIPVREKLAGRRITFLPVLELKDENKKGFLPLSLTFTLKLLSLSNISDADVYLFQRVEPVLAFVSSPKTKALIVHNDIPSSVLGKTKEVPWSHFPRIYLAFEKYIFKHLSGLWSVSGNTLSFYEKQYQFEHMTPEFIPTWVDENSFAKVDREKRDIKQEICQRHPRLSPDCSWLLFVGRFQKQKNPIRLLETFDEVRKLQPEAQLLLIGEGNLEALMRDWVDAHDLNESVIFLGSMATPELEVFYQASDLFLLTSDYEGMPLCALESLSCGTPVAATAVGEIPRIIQPSKNGELATLEAIDTLPMKILRILRNPGIYTAENCSNSIAAYRPERILQPFYEKLSAIHAAETS